MKITVATLAIIAFLVCLASTSQASPSDYQTHFTFSQPVALPGVTLPPGKYVFRLADPAGERKTIRVTDQSGKRSYALLTALPTHRSDARGESTISLMRTPAGMPAAVKTWWPTGESLGFEFVYPEAQYARLTGTGSSPSTVAGSGVPAQADHARAVAMPLQGPAKARPGNAVRITRAPRIVPPPEATRSSVPTTILSSTADPTAADVTPRRQRSNSGSPLPMLAVLGTLTFFAARWALANPRG